MVDSNPNIIIILNARRLNITIERQRLSVNEKKNTYNSAYKTHK